MILSLVKTELDYWIIKPQTDLRLESMDDDFRVMRPVLEGVRSMFRKKSKGFNATILAIVSCQYQEPVVADIGKPYFFLDQEPVRMMGNVDVSPSFRWGWGPEVARARYNVPNERHPEEIIVGVGA